MDTVKCMVHHRWGYIPSVSGTVLLMTLYPCSITMTTTGEIPTPAESSSYIVNTQKHDKQLSFFRIYKFVSIRKELYTWRLCCSSWIIVTTHLSTAHCTKGRPLVLILSCQINSIHNTQVLEAIRLMRGKPWNNQVQRLCDLQGRWCSLWSV